MFKILSTCKGGGYHYVRTEPKHPNANKMGLYPRHRVVVENSIGRLLTTKEVVHHINGDKYDDRIENLVVMTQSNHAKYHAKNVEPIIATCYFCQNKFKVAPNQYRLRIKRNKNGRIYCSPECNYAILRVAVVS